MINAFIGKLEGDGSVAFIYCHEHGDMSRLGKTLFENFSNEEQVEQLLNSGHCEYPGNNGNKNVWKLPNKKQYASGETFKQCSNKKEYLEEAVEDVQAVYLYVNGKWKYANAMSITPGFVPVQCFSGGNLRKTHNTEKKFKKRIGYSF